MYKKEINVRATRTLKSDVGITVNGKAYTVKDCVINFDMEFDGYESDYFDSGDFEFTDEGDELTKFEGIYDSDGNKMDDGFYDNNEEVILDEAMNNFDRDKAEFVDENVYSWK